MQQWEAITTCGFERAKVRNEDKGTEIPERTELWRRQVMVSRLFPHEVVTVSEHMERSYESTGQEALPGQRATAEGLSFPTKTVEARLWNNVLKCSKKVSAIPEFYTW